MLTGPKRFRSEIFSVAHDTLIVKLFIIFTASVVYSVSFIVKRLYKTSLQIYNLKKKRKETNKNIMTPISAYTSR